MTTYIEQVQRIARARGFDVTDDEADFLLWEFTGFPHFFQTDQPHRELRRQIRAFFREPALLPQRTRFFGTKQSDEPTPPG